MTGVRCGLFGVLGGCAVDLTIRYAAVYAVIVRDGSYAGVVHGVGDVG